MEADATATATGATDFLDTQNVFEYAPSNCLGYTQGSFHLIIADIERALDPRDASAAIAACEAFGVADAFARRRELVNFKKLLLHLFQSGQREERVLSQLLTFFHTDLLEDGSRVHAFELSAAQARYLELAAVNSHFRGGLKAVHDARDQCKAICLMPRHPAFATPKRLLAGALPEAFSVWPLLAKAEELCTNHEAVMASWSRRFEVYQASVERGVEWRKTCSKTAAAPPPRAAVPQATVPAAAAPAAAPAVAPAVGAALAAAARAADPALPPWHRELGALHAALRAPGCGLGPAAADLVCWSVLARGGMKALQMSAALGEYARALETTNARFEAARLALEGVRPADPSASPFAARLSMHIDTAVSTCSGAVLLGADLARALRAILAVRALDGGSRAKPQAQLFVAGDDDASGASASFFDAASFRTPQLLFAASGPVVGARMAELLASLASSGWTNKMKPKATAGQRGEHVCRQCAMRLTSLWMNNRVCLVCEAAARSAGYCAQCGTRPGAAETAAETAAAAPAADGGTAARARAAGKPRGTLWCAHAARCFACDLHSCARCRLVRADGEAVEALVHREAAGRGVFALCVDFDRTLASTRTGGSPLVGAHSTDFELLSLLCSPPAGLGRLAVVTRNAHVAEIRTFLRARGVPESVLVLHVGKGVRKSAVMAAHGLLPAADADAPSVCVFVDDSIDEHLADTRLADDARVLRVLFARGQKGAELG